MPKHDPKLDPVPNYQSLGRDKRKTDPNKLAAVYTTETDRTHRWNETMHPVYISSP
jgi:hypothetical protein